MKISFETIPKVHNSVVAAFVALCAVIFGFLWLHAGGKISQGLRRYHEHKRLYAV